MSVEVAHLELPVLAAVDRAVGEVKPDHPVVGAKRLIKQTLEHHQRALERSGLRAEGR
jgi:hypothetical protein